MRLGQKNGLVRQWARKGSRSRQPADQHYKDAYLFGAVPARGVGAGLPMTYADTQAMQRDITLQELRAALAQRGVLVGYGGLGRFFRRRAITVEKRRRTPPSRTARMS